MKTEQEVKTLLNKLKDLNERELLGDYSQEVSGMIAGLESLLGSNEVEEFIKCIEESVD